MKELILRIYQDQINCIFSDGLTVEELGRLIDWANYRISEKKAMMPKKEAQ